MERLEISQTHCRQVRLLGERGFALPWSSWHAELLSGLPPSHAHELVLAVLAGEVSEAVVPHQLALAERRRASLSLVGSHDIWRVSSDRGLRRLSPLHGYRIHVVDLDSLLGQSADVACSRANLLPNDRRVGNIVVAPRSTRVALGQRRARKRRRLRVVGDADGRYFRQVRPAHVYHRSVARVSRVRALLGRHF